MGSPTPPAVFPRYCAVRLLLVPSMAHGLADQQFRSYKDMEKWLNSWIASKDENFYRNGIRALPERWAKVVANDEQYFQWFIYNHFFSIKLHFHKKKPRELSCAPNSLFTVLYVVSLSQVFFAIFPMDKNIKERICLKFCIANGMSLAESLKMLQKAYGESNLSKTRAYE